MTKESTNNNDEIDLIDIFSIVWKKKWNIILLTFVLLVLTTILNFFSKAKDLEYYATNEIRGITAYENEKYNIYNSTINSIKPTYLKFDKKTFIYPSEKELESSSALQNPMIENQYSSNLQQMDYYDGLQLNNINKLFLINLFIDQLNDKTNIKNALRDSGFFKKEDYASKLEFETTLNDFASKVSLSHRTVDKISENQKKYLTVELKNSQLENWEKFLKYIEKKTNDEIRIKITEIFEDQINYILFKNKYKIDQINNQLNETNSKYLISQLNQEKLVLSNNNYASILREIFADSQILKPGKFYAAKIIYDYTEYDLEKQFTLKKLYIIITIIGLTFGTFFVLLLDAIKRRK